MLGHEIFYILLWLPLYLGPVAMYFGTENEIKIH